MYCPNCGYEISEKDNFCPNCGKLINNLENNEEDPFEKYLNKSTSSENEYDNGQNRNKSDQFDSKFNIPRNLNYSNQVGKFALVISIVGFFLPFINFFILPFAIKLGKQSRNTPSASLGKIAIFISATSLILTFVVVFLIFIFSDVSQQSAMIIN